MEHRIPSSDCFLTLLSPPKNPSYLYETDVFWTDFSPPHPTPLFSHSNSPGILAALSNTRPMFFRKPVTLPKQRETEYSQSVPTPKFLKSVPVSVPVRSPKGDDGDDEREEETLPPHEIAARGSFLGNTTFSVLEGVGRTLKGRDLRQVRNAVWRQTGFLD